MNQENLNQEEIRELIKDLEGVGLESRLRVLVSFDVNPNEFLYTNTTMFISSYWGKNTFHPETEVQYYKDPEDRNMLKISGSSIDVGKIQKDFPSFPWVDERTIEVISEEQY